MNKGKVLTIVSYIFAIPMGILAYLFSALLLTLYTPIEGSYETYFGILIRFIWLNFGHFIAFFWGLNITLPNHKFIITLILASILSTIFIIMFIFYIYLGILTAEIIFAFILNLLAFIVSPIMSYYNKFKNLSE